jgi:hypothetical protein
VRESRGLCAGRWQRRRLWTAEWGSRAERGDASGCVRPKRVCVDGRGRAGTCRREVRGIRELLEVV